MMRVAMVVALLVLSACGKSLEVQTEVLVRLSCDDEELKSALTDLDIRVALRDGAGWKKPAIASVPKDKLRWPVDIPVTARRDEDAFKEFEIVIAAKQGDTILAETRAVTSFEGTQSLLALTLYRCDCPLEACQGEACSTCKAPDLCAPVGKVDSTSLPPISSEPGGLDGGSISVDFDATVSPILADTGTSMPMDAGAMLPDVPQVVVEPDAGAPVVNEDYALGEEGKPCANGQTLACADHASRTVLECQAGVWSVAKICASSERCESRTGMQTGACLVMPTACVGKAAGDVCDGDTRMTCNIDLIAIDSHACPANSHCNGQSPVACVCDRGFRLNSAGACENPNDCKAGYCANGMCVDGLDDYSCKCNDGYDGTGTKQCIKTKYCPANACAGGTCNDVMDWSCTCGSGFRLATDKRACTNIDDCPATCRTNGSCVDGVNKYTCTCNTGFVAPDCTDPCNPNPCPQNYACSRTGTRCTRMDLGMGTGADVITMGDAWMSFVNMVGIQYSLENASGQDYRNYAVPGVKVLDETIPNQYVRARAAGADIKTVVMTGGGDDTLQDATLAAGCNDSAFGAACKTRQDQIVARLERLWAQMATDGVRDIVMVPYARQSMGGKYMSMLTYLRQKLQVSCAAVSAPARCQLYDTDSVPNFTERTDALHPTDETYDAIGAGVWQLMQSQGIRR